MILADHDSDIVFVLAFTELGLWPVHQRALRGGSGGDWQQGKTSYKCSDDDNIYKAD